MEILPRLVALVAQVADDLHEAAQVRHAHALAALVGSHDGGGAHLEDEDLGRERHGHGGAEKAEIRRLIDRRALSERKASLS